MKNGINYQFDFEIGYLVKSPCLRCQHKKDFPRCMDTCHLLVEIHEILTESISCTRRV